MQRIKTVDRKCQVLQNEHLLSNCVGSLVNASENIAFSGCH